MPYAPPLPNYIRITDISDDGYFIKENRTSVECQDSEVYTLKEAKISSLKSTEEEDYITPKIDYSYFEKDVNSEVVSAATGIPQLKKAYLPLELTQVTEGVQLSLTIPENVNCIDVYRNDEQYMSY